MSLKDDRIKLLNDHKVIFELIVIVSNQIIRQEQLTKILIETNYCTNAVAVTRLLKRFEDVKLIKRYKEGSPARKMIQATKPSLDFVMGKGIVVKPAESEIRSLRNAVMVELFRTYFIKSELTLSEALELALNTSNSNLFKSSESFYSALNQNDLAFHSFNSKSSSYFSQLQEINDVKNQKKAHMEVTASTREKTGKINAFERKCWTLDDLKNRQIYFRDFELVDPTIEEKIEWIGAHYHRFKWFEPKILELNFTLMTLSSNPSKKDLVGRLFNLHKFVKKSFKMHHSYFIEDKKIGLAAVKVRVNVEVVVINDYALNNIDQADVVDWIERKIARYSNSYSFKYDINVTFKSLNINNQNEHLTY